MYCEALDPLERRDLFSWGDRKLCDNEYGYYCYIGGVLRWVDIPCKNVFEAQNGFKFVGWKIISYDPEDNKIEYLGGVHLFCSLKCLLTSFIPEGGA